MEEFISLLTGFARRLAEAHEHIADLHALIADLQARIERMGRAGKVTDVDATKWLARFEIGLDDDGNSVKSPWLPYSQHAGDRKVHSLPSVGQQVMCFNPDGSPDFTLGMLMPYHWYDQIQSPSTDPNADVATRGSTVDTTRPGSRVITADKNAAVNIQKDGWVMATVQGTPQFVIYDAGAHKYYTIDPAALVETQKPPDPT